MVKEKRAIGCYKNFPIKRLKILDKTSGMNLWERVG